LIPTLALWAVHFDFRISPAPFDRVNAGKTMMGSF